MDLTSAEAHELLGAYVLDALGDDELAAVEEHVARDPELRRAVEELRAVGAWLGASDAATPPPALRGRTLRAALARRPPGQSLHRRSRPLEGFTAQVSELSVLLGDVSGDSWGLPTAAGFTVHELIGHLVAVEGYMGRVLGIGDFEPPAGTEGDHVAMTWPSIETYRGRPPGEALAEWRALVAANVQRLSDLGDDALRDRMSFHGLDVSLGSLLVIRMFELWTHTDDIRRALDRPLAAPSAGRLSLMAATAVRGLPMGLALSGFSAPGRTAKIVLTGPGGGTFHQALDGGEASDEADVLIVTDVVSFCRLAARRLAPADLERHVEGDVELAESLLVGAQMFSA